ncbi:MAG: class F sortase [Chloroflexota bacterium]
MLLFSLAAVVLTVVIGGGGYAIYSMTRSNSEPELVDTVSNDQPVTQVHATARPTLTAAPTPAPTPVPPFEGQTFRLSIDSIGVDAPVVAEGLDADQVPITPLNSYEVAWYNFTAQPGTAGNAVFAGHKTWDGEAVFYKLDQLEPGDTLHLIGDGDGKQLTYTVTDTFTVSESDPNAVQVMGPTAGDVVTLITCDGTRYYTGDPVYGHDYTDRRVIRAERTDVVTPASG